MAAKKLRSAALALAVLPIIALLVLTAAELVGGDISGVQHLFQIAPLALLVWAAWRWPEAGGIVLATVGLGLAMVYPVLTGLPARTVVVTEVLLFVPVILAGALFVVSARSLRGQGDSTAPPV
jgi:hypothetical protein